MAPRRALARALDRLAGYCYAAAEWLYGPVPGLTPQQDAAARERFMETMNAQVARHQEGMVYAARLSGYLTGHMAERDRMQRGEPKPCRQNGRPHGPCAS